MAKEESAVSQEPRVWASLGCTITTRQYENVKIDIGVSGIPIDCSPEHLAVILKGAQLQLQRVVDSLAEEMSRRIENDFPGRS